MVSVSKPNEEFDAPEIEVVANTNIEVDGLEDLTELPYGDEEDNYSYQTTSYFGGVFSQRKKVIVGLATILLVLCVTGFGAAVAQRSSIVSNYQFTPAPTKATKPPKSKTPKSKTPKEI